MQSECLCVRNPKPTVIHILVGMRVTDSCCEGQCRHANWTAASSVQRALLDVLAQPMRQQDFKAFKQQQWY